MTNHHTGCAKDVPGQNNSGSQSSSSGSSQQKEQQAWAKYDKAERDYDNDHAANVAEAAAARQAGRCSEGFGAITPSCADAKRRQSTHENNASDAASRMNSDNHACHDAIKAVKEARDEEQQEELQSIRKQPTPSSCKGDYQGIMRH